MSQQTYVIQFGEDSVADANMYADQLRDALLDAAPDASVETRRADPESQDLGSILILSLGTPAVIALAKALGDWLKLHHSVSINITTPEGSYVANNLTSKDAHKLVELLQGNRKD